MGPKLIEWKHPSPGFPSGGGSNITQGGNKMKEHSQPIRAAAYCRVSTLQEEQEGSYELQMAYFRRKIEEHPGMVLAGLYGDRGKSA